MKLAGFERVAVENHKPAYLIIDERRNILTRILSGC
jgi:hypothetical protein